MCDHVFVFSTSSLLSSQKHILHTVHILHTIHTYLHATAHMQDQKSTQLEQGQAPKSDRLHRKDVSLQGCSTCAHTCTTHVHTYTTSTLPRIKTAVSFVVVHQTSNVCCTGHGSGCDTHITCVSLQVNLPHYQVNHLHDKVGEVLLDIKCLYSCLTFTQCGKPACD